MESITHALIGLGVATLTGEPISLNNPLYLGAMIASVAPDLDIIMQLGGHLKYLRHHRGISHSIPSLTIISIIITGILKLIYPLTTGWEIFIWTFLGALSHSLMDILNSYGAKIFWPISKKMFNLNLLMIFDPFIFIIFGSLLFSKYYKLPFADYAIAIFGLFGMYLLFRLYMRLKLKNYLKKSYGLQDWSGSFILSESFRLGTWYFAIRKDNKYLIGQINFFNKVIQERCHLDIPEVDDIIKIALNSKMGMLFRGFTPYIHYSHTSNESNHIINFIDLRYLIKNEFLHSATVIIDRNYKIVEGIFHPYSKKYNIKIEG